MKTIALCMNTPGMDQVEWTQWEYGKKYPGAGWLKHLPMLSSSDYPRFVDGKNCLNNGFNPKDVIVIQEENNPEGQELVKLGTDARVLMCLESPIFAPSFYDNIPTNFKHRLLFNGGTEHVYFPSFDDEDLKDPVLWNDRKFLCMVMSNKHYSMLRQVRSPSLQKAMETQLHDYRYEAIEYFQPSLNRDFDLYGKGWQMSAPECSDKLATIRNYKFALCFENGSYPGYITEKIIDCLVAGVVPVYRGAMDIEKYIPRELFIDARSFSSFQQMEAHLRDVVQWRAYDSDYFECMNRIKCGQEWLRSPEGQRYNNRVFAKRILEMCE